MQLSLMRSRAGTGEHAVGGAGVDLLRAADLDQSLGRVAEGAGGVHDVVEHDAGLALDVADDVHDLGDVGLGTALVHDGEVHMDLLGEVPGAGHGAHVGRDRDDAVVVAGLRVELVHVVVYEQRCAGEVIQRDVEEALNLGGVQVHGQDAVSAGGGEHVGDELGGDGVAASGLAVLAGVAVVGDHGGDPAGGGAAQGVDVDEHRHQVVVDRLAGGLDDEAVSASDRLVYRDGALPIGKVGNIRVAQTAIQVSADQLGQSRVGVAGEDHDFFAV